MSLKFRTVYGLVHKATDLLDFAAKAVELPLVQLQELMELGSFYVNDKRTLENLPLQANDQVRLHLRPKRYAKPTTFHVIAESAEYIIVKKSSAVPCHATVDNLRENLHSWLKEERSENLYVTHRLDVGTEGLIVYAKTPTFLKHFNRELEFRRVEKKYFALSREPLPLGLQTHWMPEGSSSPRVCYEEERENTQICQLKILASTPLEQESLYCHEILLLTGRTHQIRAQLKALGQVLLGDALYQDGSAPTHECFALQAFSLKFRDTEEREIHVETPLGLEAFRKPFQKT